MDRHIGREDFIELLQRHSIRETANRLLVLRALAAEKRPVSLSELESRIDSIDKSGIFRTLTLFRDRHLVHTLEDGGDGVRYELCLSSDEREDDDLHVHFYCENCRKTTCMENIPVPCVQLPDGYEKQSVNYMIKGICPDCAERD